MAQNNVIELVLRLRDQLSGPLTAASKKINAIGGVAGIAALATVGVALTRIVRETIKSETELRNLDRAFASFGQTAKVTRSEVDKFTEATQRTSIFSGGELNDAQATLLRFSAVAQGSFGRARQASLDLSAALGVELTSAATIVGRALERPSTALRQLRQVGIVFSREQEEQIKLFERTGRAAQAQELILSRLEKQFKGAADAAANSLGGSLLRLQNAFDNLFTASTKASSASARVFGDLADSLSDPEVVNALQTIASLLLTIIARAIEAAALLAKVFVNSFTPDSELDKLFEKQSNLGASLEIAFKDRERALSKGAKERADNLIARIRGEISAVEREIQAFQSRQRITSGRPRRGGRAGPAATEDEQGGDTETIGLSTPFVRRGITGGTLIEFEKNTRYLEQMAAAQALVLTDTRRTVAAYEELERAIADAVAQFPGLREQGNARLNEELDNILTTVKITAKKVEVPLSATQERFNEFADSIGSGIGNAISEGGLNGLTSLRDIVKQSLRNIVADILTSGISKALRDVFKVDGMSSSGGGFFGNILKGIGTLFGFGAAGGGIITKPTWVGESGRELAIPMGSTRIYNQRQLAGIMGGAGATGPVVINSNPQVVVNGDVSEKNQSMILAAMEQTHARSMREMVRTLERNGLRRPI